MAIRKKPMAIRKNPKASAMLRAAWASAMEANAMANANGDAWANA
jgi:hypothetical protein